MKKAYSIVTIMVLIILGAAWFFLPLFSLGLSSENETIRFLSLTGPYLGLTTFVWGIIKYFERIKILRQNNKK